MLSSRALLVLGVSISIAGRASAAGALDKPAFTATPDELLAVAKSVTPGDAPVVVLRDDVAISFDDAGRATERTRLVFVVLTKAGVDDWGTIGVDWSPFYQNKPVVRARVIASRDQVSELDPKLVTDAPSVTESPSVFSDRRNLEAPLPRLEVGAVVEQEIMTVDREPLLGAGSVGGYRIGRSVPVQHSVMTISWPDRRPVHIATRGFAKPPVPTRTTQGGRTTWAFDIGAQAAVEPRPIGTPSEIATFPMIGYASGASWAAIAADYRTIVEAKLKLGPPTLPADFKPTADRASVDRIVAWLHAHVRYTGIEFSQAAIVPFPPAETLKRGFGDCKDQATLLVGLLRAAGIDADLVLLDTGPGLDMDRTLAGMGPFDHAIVRARLAGKDVWIDATEDDLPAGQLPVRDQGRLALIVAPTTTDLVRTPMSVPSDNVVREIRTFHAAEYFEGRATEVSTETGVFWDGQRSWIRDTKRDQTSKSLGDYVASAYGGKLVTFSSTDANDVTRPFALTLEIDHVTRVLTELDKLVAYLAPTAALVKLPSLFTTRGDRADRDVKDRKLDYVWSTPLVTEIENRIELPPGYQGPQLVAHDEQKLGTMTLVTTRKLEGSTIVVTYRLDSGKVRMTPAEVQSTRAAVLALQNAPLEQIEAKLTASVLVEQGKIKEGVAEVERLIALHPKEAVHHDQLAKIYRRAGLGAAARRAARKAVDVEPNADAWSILGFQLRRDTLAREYGFDADRKGAIAAYRKALVANPDHVGALVELASLLADGEDFHGSTDPRERLEAVKLWRHANELSKGTHYDLQIASSLLFAGSFAEAETAARALTGPERATLTLTAIVAQHGVRDMLRQVDALAPGKARKQVLGAVAAQLVQLRRYADARALFAEFRDTTTDPKQAMVFDKIAPVDLAKLPATDPRTPALLALVAMIGQRVPGPVPWDDDLARDFAQVASTFRSSPKMKPLEQLPPSIMIDTFLALADPKVEGSARDGWRVELDFGGMARLQVYEIAVAGKPRVIATVETPRAVATTILQLLGKHDTAGAMRWWKRLGPDLEASSSWRSIVSAYKAELAHAGTAEPSTALVEATAAILASDHAPKVASPILATCASFSTAEFVQECKTAQRIALTHAREWRQLADVTRDAPDTDPLASTIVGRHAYALAMLGQFDDAAKALDAALTKHPDDFQLVGVRAMLASVGPSWPDAQAPLDRLAKHPRVTAVELNNMAWIRLLRDPTPDKAKELGARAEKMSSELAPNLANTLAAIEAESDRPTEAWTYLRKSLDKPSVPPSDADWYVIGRIAESYGLRDDAIAAYHRVAKPANRLALDPTAFDFVQRRLTAMGAH